MHIVKLIGDLWRSLIEIEAEKTVKSGELLNDGIEVDDMVGVRSSECDGIST